MILAGDIGGTNSRLAVFDSDLRLVRESSYTNAGRGSLGEIVQEFLKADKPRIEAATFGVAGPVRDGHVTLTNIHWDLEERTLAAELGIPRVELINDLRAHAEGIELLKPSDLNVVNAPPAARKPGNRAIIAAGTGLGEAGLVWDSNAILHHPVACEGGHCDFAALTDQEIALLNHLRQRRLPTTWESVLSGPGLRNIYDFLITEAQLGRDAALPNPDPRPSEISKAALANSNRAASAALELFITFYGAEAGNLALKFLATDGIYLGGGIAPQVADRIRASTIFLERFRRKGPEKIQAVLKSIPIFIITCTTNALYGAANHARRL